METFEKKIKKIKRSNLFSIIVLSIIAIVLLIMAIIEIIPNEQKIVKYNKNSRTSRYVTSNILYLMGPILKSTNTSSQEKYNYYIATDENNEIFIIKFNEDTKGIPVLGIDIKEEEIENINPIQINGTILDISATLNEAIVKSIKSVLKNDDESTGILSEFIGNYYFNASNDKDDTAKNMFIAMGIFALIDVYYILLTIKINKNVDNTINTLSKEGKLEDIKNEYESDKLIEYKKLKVNILPKYIFSYSYGLAIIPFSEIKNVYATKKTNERTSKYKYITIETNNGSVYYIAPLTKKNQKGIFDELLQKIKSMQK